MAVRVLVVMAVLVSLHGYGRSSPPPAQPEKEGFEQLPIGEKTKKDLEHLPVRERTEKVAEKVHPELLWNGPHD